MQSIFRLPWCTDQDPARLQTGKVALEAMRTSPVMDVSALNKLKRKRTCSPEPCLPPRMHLVKKQRPQGDSWQQPRFGAGLLPVKSELEHVFTQAPCAAAPIFASFQQEANTDPEQTDGGILYRTDSVTAFHPDTTSGAADNELDAAALKMEDVSMEGVQAPPAEDVMGLTPLQQVIENEFNMQILTKHNELRLIEQELAKCQIALEQLRRCELRPYLGVEQPSASVSAGTGAAIAPSPGYSRPSHPAPHGVTDGPYARHYRQWLLQDPQFDSKSVHALSPADSAVDAAARATRGNGSARKSVQKSFTMPSRSGDALHSLPNYPASGSKDKSTPLVLRRSTDNQLVKLICNNCLRGNFSSIQGFLNHCRIAHKVDYKSHDAAAVDCGRLLDEQEAANLPPEALVAAVAHKPSASRSSSTATTPYKTQNYVHPMNSTVGGSLPSSVASRARSKGASKPTPVRPLVSVAGSQGHSSQFTASSQAPRLSAHFAKYQLGGNLEQAIATAKQRVDLGGDEEVMSPDALDSASPSTPVVGSRTVFGTSRPGSLAPSGALGRPLSRKGHREPLQQQRHRPSPLAPHPAHVLAAQSSEHGEIPESPQHHSANHSPNTADSEPGLVSDHEDDDHGSASEDEVPQEVIAHSLGVRREGCSDNMDIDVAVDDDLDQHGVVIRRNSMLAGDERGLRTAGSPSRKLGASGKGA